MTVGQRVYLVVIDSYSKWVECLHMNDGTSTKALIAKLKQVFSTFGIPNVLVSDNDVKINSEEFKNFCSSNGIKYMTSPIYHPPSNGQAENSVRTCKRMLKCILNDNLPLYKVNELLLGYLFNYRNTVHCTTGETPSKLMFGRNLRSRLDLVVPSREPTYVEALTKSKREFTIGDVVWTRWYSARKETWQLGIIKERIGIKMYRIYISDLDVDCIRHVDQLWKYTGSTEPTNTVTSPHQEQPLNVPNNISSAVSVTDNVPVATDMENGQEEVGRDCEAMENEGRAADGTYNGITATGGTNRDAGYRG
ncbi:hypothetical protein PYW07_008527 [Mythimna separata]|uniref:Integrase catalytic domain-containing protein n=1 Tax=Mythimna separata TaxID=271217 RepID=A0AAD8DMY5_MYTSE|nr:hypothetical protein PYW07_008527 [Mythimna separata]